MVSQACAYFGGSAGTGASEGPVTPGGVPVGGPSGHVGQIGGGGAPGCVTLLGADPACVPGMSPTGGTTGDVWSFQK
jgi:hypothetical protein